MSERDDDRGELARLTALAEARKHQVELVAAVGHALVAHGTLREQLHGTVSALARVLEASSARVWLLDEARREFVLFASAGNTPAAARSVARTADRDAPRSSASDGALSRALHASGGIIDDDRGGDGEEASAVLPLTLNERRWGVIEIVCGAAKLRATREVLSVVVDQVSLALGKSHAAAEGVRLAALVSQGEVREAAARAAEEQALRAFAFELERRVVERTRELQDANEQLESFSYSVSHDLRAPIRHISGFADMLERHARDQLDARAQHYVKTIAVAARQAGTLIDDLLSFARVGRAEIAMERVHLDAVFASVRREVIAEASGRVVEWRVDPLPEVVGDPAMLRVVVKNLLGNAMKYTRHAAHAKIEVLSRIEGNDVVVSVRDNGVGFDMQHAHKLFGVFQRLHRSDEFEGTGIGLASVGRIIHRHGGRTFAEGRLGEGATVGFALPRVEPPREATTSP